jgi:hypothetical protein
MISARPFGVSSTFGYPLSNEGVQITSQAILENPNGAGRFLEHAHHFPKSQMKGPQ